VYKKGENQACSLYSWVKYRKKKIHKNKNLFIFITLYGIFLRLGFKHLQYRVILTILMLKRYIFLSTSVHKKLDTCNANMRFLPILDTYTKKNFKSVNFESYVENVKQFHCT